MTIRKFMEKVVVDAGSGCWIFQGSKTKDGYGVVMLDGPDGRTSTTAHRWIYQQTYGVRLARQTDLDHECRQRSCVNPHHVAAMTHRLNCELDAVRRKTRA